MRRLLEQTLGGFGLSAALADTGAWVPLVDIEERDDGYVIEAELPGVKREDVNVELVGNEVTISGEVQEQERQGVLRGSARRTGRFHYRVALPNAIDIDKAEAELNDGILTIRVPKSETAPRRRVEIKSS
jgi:HSP20 family protein